MNRSDRISQGRPVPNETGCSKPVSGKEAVKYPKPKILLLGVDDEAADALTKIGFNISIGTFGTPYKVPNDGGYKPLIGKAKLPNHTEQEIIIVDLSVPCFDTGPQGDKHLPDSETDLWAKCNRGFIDPRPRAACRVREAFDRTYSNGGIFIVFADAKTQIELITACRDSGYGGGHLYDETPFPYDAWDFLSELSTLTVSDDHGEEMVIADPNSALGKFVSRHLGGGRFTCTLGLPMQYVNPWNPLVNNKFGEPVGAWKNVPDSGMVIILPQLADKPNSLAELLTQVLPEIAPKLFPHVERGQWTHKCEYELSRVLEMKARQDEIKARAKAEVEGLECEIAEERKTNGWLHDLLTGTDVELVEAVKKALRHIGFEGIIDVDEERDKEGKARREDLQIHDASPILILDIKGLGGHPSDDDAFQSHKHATLRVQEWKQFDVQALTVINHQRYLPPLGRDNAMPFRQEILDFSAEVKMGLITAWDLYRFVRSALRWRWKTENTKPVIYGLGRIDPVPKHYTYIGSVAHVWTGVVSIQIEVGGLCLGNRIAFELDVEFAEQEVTSLQVDKKNAESAGSGSLVGTESNLTRPAVRDGMRVFVVQK